MHFSKIFFAPCLLDRILTQDGMRVVDEGQINDYLQSVDDNTLKQSVRASGFCGFFRANSLWDAEEFSKFKDEYAGDVLSWFEQYKEILLLFVISHPKSDVRFLWVTDAKDHRFCHCLDYWIKP